MTPTNIRVKIGDREAAVVLVCACDGIEYDPRFFISRSESVCSVCDYYRWAALFWSDYAAERPLLHGPRSSDE